MSAQKSINWATHRPHQGEQRGQPTQLARRSALPTLAIAIARSTWLLRRRSLFPDAKNAQGNEPRVSQAGLDFSGRGDDFLSTAWVPAAEIAYRDGNLIVSAELPGLTEKDVQG